MKRLKKFWHENSVLLVLLLILIACLVAISVVVVTYFVGDARSKYGDRLEGIESCPFDEEIETEIITKIESDELVKNVKIKTSDTKTIYVIIDFVAKTSLVEAQSKALASLEYFKEELLNFYDIEFMIKADSTEDTEGFQIMGSHNVSGTGGIVWNNNTTVKEELEK